MALIWVAGFTGAKSLAAQWLRAEQARLKAADLTQPAAQLGQAMVTAAAELQAYKDLVAEATQVSKALPGESTHAFVAGIGRYQSPKVKAVTTSVHGAIAFVKWLLEEFQNPDRPLASIDLFLSRPAGLPESALDGVAVPLGLQPGEVLAEDPATFDSLRNGFDQFIDRCRPDRRDQGFIYLAGHGMWKNTPLLLAEDAVVGDTFDKIIDIGQTEKNMFNAAPSIQCFFLDACQEITLPLIQDLSVLPGLPLRRATKGAALAERDARTYMASYTGMLAYGPTDGAPFFTQELLECLRCRGAERQDNNEWVVTTDSLRKGMEAASLFRRDREKVDLQFSTMAGASTFSADLCRFKQTPKVFVRLSASPQAMPLAKLWVENPVGNILTRAPSASEWCTVVDSASPCKAGAEFNPPAPFNNVTQSVDLAPPVVPVRLRP